MDFPWKTQYLSSKEININNLYIFLKNFQHSPEQRLESQKVHDGPVINISHYAYKLCYLCRCLPQIPKSYRYYQKEHSDS